jgi:prepilin peptidase CpaA
LRGNDEGGGADCPLLPALSEPSQDGAFSISWEQRGSAAREPSPPEARLRPLILAGAVLLAMAAGWTDLRSRRIPNWLTVPGLAIGIAANTILGGWSGLKTSLLGAALGLGLLLPFVLLRSLGAGDWKLAGALGAFTGPVMLIDLLLASVFVAGLMAVALVIYKGRVLQTLRNIGHILVSLVTFRLPGSRVSLDNPDSLKVPYGVALALTVMLYGIFWKLRMVA